MFTGVTGTGAIARILGVKNAYLAPVVNHIDIRAIISQLVGLVHRHAESLLSVSALIVMSMLSQIQLR